LTRIVHLSIAPEHREAFEAYVAQKIKVVADQPGFSKTTAVPPLLPKFGPR
jgi:antibiotic biosynthesis monooxygenase (ABM) superfamily enzyme